MKTTVPHQNSRMSMSGNPPVTVGLGTSEAITAKRKMNFLAIAAITIACLGGLVFGLDIGSTGPSLDMDGFRREVCFLICVDFSCSSI